MRMWFVNLETDLFKFRWEVIREFFPGLLRDFIEQTNLYQRQDNSVDYKVPWTEAVHLVRTRNVTLEDGMAIISCAQLLPSVEGVFRKELFKNTVLTTKALPSVDNDGRLATLMMNINQK